ncbi:MAG: DUF4199 domain-containing protein [Bacteroidetes bacterium]|nr:DUF4199 domain-containing protein [Bacteroidota bacterium]
MKSVSLRYGLIGGSILLILGILTGLFLTPAGYRAAEIGGYVSILAACSMIFFGIRYYRDNVNEGRLKFGEALKLGMLISLIPSLVMFIGTALLIHFWGDGFVDWTMEYMEANLAPEELAKQKEAMASMGNLATNPFFQGGVMFLTVLLIGLVISVLSAFSLKRS